jgi:Predicted transcriptional regulators
VNTFIERLKAQRGDLNQAEFARKLGLPPNSYHRYESGARVPDIDVLSQMAQRLSVSTDYLLGLDSQSGIQENHSGISTTNHQAQMLVNQSETLVNQSQTLVNQSAALVSQSGTLNNQTEVMMSQSKTLENASESLTVLARSLEVAIRKGKSSSKNRGTA